VTFKHLPSTQDYLAARAWLFAGAPSAHKDIDARHAVHTLIDLVEALPEIIPQYCYGTPEHLEEMRKPPPPPPPERKSRERVDMENAIYRVLSASFEALETKGALDRNGHHYAQELMETVASAVIQRAERRILRGQTMDKLNWRTRLEGEKVTRAEVEAELGPLPPEEKGDE
jgi:hypothetical protein